MALKGTLKIGDKVWNVQDCDYEFMKPYDNNFKPSAHCKGGLINFSILSDDKEDLFFHDWMFKTTDLQKGTFTFGLTKTNDGGIPDPNKQKIVSFSNAYCVYLAEYYSNSNSSPMYMRITISAAIIEFGTETSFFNLGLALEM